MRRGEPAGWVNALAVAGLAAYLVWSGLSAGNYALRVLSIAGIYGIASIGYQFIFGHAGALALSQATFMGLGAYTSGILALRLGLPFDVALPLSIGAPVLLALVIAAPVLRLQTHYFALATLIISQVAYLVATEWTGLTGGANGLGGVPPISLLGVAIRPGWPLLATVWGFVAVGALVAWQITRGRLGQAWACMRSAPAAAGAIGLDAARLRLIAFLLSAAYAGLAGSLYVHALRVVSPDALGFPVVVTCLTIVMVGSRLRPVGALLGAVLIIQLPEWFRDLRDYYLLAYGGILLAVVVLAPAGLLGTVEGWAARLFSAASPPPAPRPIRAYRTQPPPHAEVRAQRVRPLAGPMTGSGEPRSTHDSGASFEEAGLRPAPQDEGVRPSLLEIAGLSKTFGGVRALDDVSLTLRAGEALGLIGPNGSGKTTLVNVVSGIYRPEAGRILLARDDITGRPPHLVARFGIARTFQTVALVDDMTALDNVAIARDVASIGLGSALRAGLRDEKRAVTRSEAAWLLDRMGAADSAMSLAGSLPYGVRRRVEIARALASEPRLVLLDEPAAGLNETEQADLAARLRALLADGTALLVIEHNMRFLAPLVDRMACLDAGALIAEGPPAKVTSDARVIEAYLGSAP